MTVLLIIEAIALLGLFALAWTAPEGWQSRTRGFLRGKPTDEELRDEAED